MPAPTGVPPGRAGRIWLRERLRTARQAADLLDRKLRVLRAEQVAARQRERDAGAEWIRCRGGADEWLLRAVLLAGERQVSLCAARVPAEVDVRWVSTLGAVHPADVDCRPAPWPGDDPVAGSCALVEAAARYRDAVRAAAATAAATATRAALDHEVEQTRRRLRAVADRRIPALERALHDRGAQLAESERVELVRLRWAAGRDGRGGTA